MKLPNWKYLESETLYKSEFKGNGIYYLPEIGDYAPGIFCAELNSNTISLLINETDESEEFSFDYYIPTGSLIYIEELPYGNGDTLYKLVLLDTTNDDHNPYDATVIHETYSSNHLGYDVWVTNDYNLFEILPLELKYYVKHKNF